jgi:glycosyltransferase involved in cell wall biosynthesis
MATVSVYIPTKDRLQSLRRAIDSVLAQTHRDIELIVVDDGSTDATAEYLLRMQLDDPRVNVIRNRQSKGAPAARNAAIRAATGEFVTGLDDDDRFHEERIQALLRRWRELEGSGARFSGLYTQDLMTHGSAESASAKIARVEYEDLFFHNSIGNQIFTRRRYLLEIGMFDEQMPAWQDLDTFMRLVERFGPAHLLDRPLYVLDLAPRPDRISVGSKQRILSAYRRMLDKLAQHPGVLKQGLFLQVFGRLYGFPFEAADLREFLRYGLHARTLWILGGVFLRQAGLR